MKNINNSFMDTVSSLSVHEYKRLISIASGISVVAFAYYLRSYQKNKNARLRYIQDQKNLDGILGFTTSYPTPTTSSPDTVPLIPLSEVPNVVRRLRQVYQTDITKSYEWRIDQLQKLQTMIEENKQEIIAAVQKDLGKKDPQEVIASEINVPLVEIEHTIKHLRDWMKPEKVATTIALLPGSSYIYKDPQGVVLIASPWNYPVNLAIVPLIGSIAGGNVALLKLSRHSSNTGRTIANLVYKYLDRRAIVAEYEGGAPMITKLIEEKWDYIFFTGSVSVGRIIYQAASKNLTPVTLELGGKNPCIVDKNVDLDLAARRIVWGKFFNCGQTCITADYLLVHKEVEQQLIDNMIRYIKEFYGEDPQQSKDYPRIISADHVKRLEKLFKCGDIAYGGKADESDKYVAPTILRNIKIDSVLMTDEIFGPVLPIVSVSSVDEAINFINGRPLALALYIFSRDQSVQESVLKRTRSGACIANELLLHFANPNLPFGGVGESGLGSYHGKLTFDTFVHRKAVIRSTTKNWLDLPLRYPPYTKTIGWLVDKVTRSGW